MKRKFISIMLILSAILPLASINSLAATDQGWHYVIARKVVDGIQISFCRKLRDPIKFGVNDKE